MAQTPDNIARKNTAQIEKQLEKYYSDAMKRTIADFESVYEKIMRAQAEGREITPEWLYQLDSYWQAQAQLKQELQKLGAKSINALSSAFEKHYYDIYNAIAMPAGEAFATVDNKMVKQLINQIIFLENQIDEVSKEIKELYDKLDSHLLSVPGVGVHLAPVILAEIGNINNFDKPSKLIAFAGTDPSENQSGNKLSSNEKTSKRGSPYLRHAIYTASLVAISNEPELRAYYDKKISEGKHHFVALAGISRKLLTIIYYILKEDRDYIRYDNIKDKYN